MLAGMKSLAAHDQERRRDQASMMTHEDIPRTPDAIAPIQIDTEALGFTMASEPKTGALLAVLAASKPGGCLLELGTGTGLGTAWLLTGMGAGTRLDTVDTDPAAVAVARATSDRIRG
jgi:predicted O-methyltransferase YrrM